MARSGFGDLPLSRTEGKIHKLQWAAVHHVLPPKPDPECKQSCVRLSLEISLRNVVIGIF